MFKFWQILFAVLGLMTPGAVPDSTTLGLNGFRPVTHRVVPSQSGGGYRRYGRPASGMPNDQRLLHQRNVGILFDISSSMGGPNARIAISLLRALQEQFGETAFVAPFGDRTNAVMTLSQAIEYFSRHNYSCLTNPAMIIKHAQTCSYKEMKWIIITDGQLNECANPIQKVADAIGNSPTVVYFTNTHQHESTIQSWKSVFTGQLVKGNMGYMLQQVSKELSLEEAHPLIGKMMFLLDNFTKSTDTVINIGPVALPRNATMNEIRKILIELPDEQLRIASDLILFAMEAISNSAAQQLIDAPWFLNVLQAFKKTPQTNFESMLDQFLTDNQQLSGIQAIFRKMREQLQYEEMMGTIYPTLQEVPELWAFIEELKTSLPRLSGINFSDNSGSWFRTLVEHLPEYAPVNVNTSQMINFFRILPTMYGMENALSDWYAKCLIVQCVVQRKMRNWLENSQEVISQVTPEYINSQFFDSVTGEIQPWVCATSMMPVIFQLAKIHFENIPILDKLVHTWISHKMIQAAKNYQFETREFSLNSHVKVGGWGFWAVLKSHGVKDPCPHFVSVVFIRWSPSLGKYVAHYFEQPAPHNFRRDIFSTGEESMWNAIDKQFLFQEDGITPKYFLKVEDFRRNPHQIMEDMTNLLRPLWLEVSQREQPDGPYYEAPDYTMVLERAVELIEACPDTVRECPAFTFTDIDRITELVAEMNGIPSQLAHQIKGRWDGKLVRAGIQTDFSEPQQTPDDYFLNTYDQVVMRLETPYQIIERREQHPTQQPTQQPTTSFNCPVCLETITEQQENVPHDPRHAVCDECMSCVKAVAIQNSCSVRCPMCRFLLEEGVYGDSDTDDQDSEDEETFSDYNDW